MNPQREREEQNNKQEDGVGSGERSMSCSILCSGKKIYYLFINHIEIQIYILGRGVLFSMFHKKKNTSQILGEC